MRIAVLKHFAAQRLDIVEKSLWISCHFDTEYYTWRLDIVQKNFCVILLVKCPKIYISKYLLQLRAENYTWRPVIVQNVLISCILLISLDQNLLVNNIYIRNIRIFLYRSL